MPAMMTAVRHPHENAGAALIRVSDFLADYAGDGVAQY
jgi:hypothetical protein